MTAAVTGSQLDVSNGSKTVTLALGSNAQALYNLATDGAGGTIVSAACFAAGTRIATAAGERPVETLREGEAIRTEAGALRALRWLGHRTIDCRTHPRPQDVWPVRVAAHAFGPGRPHRPLFLSPDHAVFAGGVLIPVRYLLNGATIAQVPRDRVTYYHVELPRHDVILAEGLPCESYLDTGNRAAFANGGASVMLHADFARGVWARDACAALVTDGAPLAAQRRALLAEARALGHRQTRAPDLHLWADGQPVRARVVAGRYRFVLPAGTAGVRLLSRSAVPAWTDPGSVDHRRLGVAVAQLTLDDVVVPLADARLGAGWHAEEGGWRWTDGAAALETGGARVLTVTLAMAARYWRPAPAPQRRAA